MRKAFKTYGASDKGRCRTQNEDSFTYFEVPPTKRAGASAPALQVAIVADGVGGNVGGELASQTAVKMIRKVIKNSSTNAIEYRFTQAIAKANQAICDIIRTRPELDGMSTTLVAAVIADNQLYVAHVGDSRAYLIRNGEAQQLTLDHTWVQEAYDLGALAEEEAEEHEDNHAITRFLGVAEGVEVDHQILATPPGNGEPAQHHTVGSLEMQQGDAILLCSDGLTDVVSPKQIAEIVDARKPKSAVKELIACANAAGGPDNITVVVMKWMPVQRVPYLRALATVAVLLVVVGLSYGIWQPVKLLLLSSGTTEPATKMATAVTPVSINTSTPSVTPTQIAKTVAILLPTTIITPTATLIPTPVPIPTTGPQSLSPIKQPPPITDTQTISSDTVITSSIGVVTLLWPCNGATVQKSQPFSWSTSYILQSDEAFEPFFWEEGHFSLINSPGLHDPITTTMVITINFDSNILDNGTLAGKLVAGHEYFWGIRLVQIRPKYQPKSYLEDKLNEKCSFKFPKNESH